MGGGGGGYLWGGSKVRWGWKKDRSKKGVNFFSASKKSILSRRKEGVCISWVWNTSV